MAMLTRIVLLACFAACALTPSFAQTYFDVPAPYPTIQAAINAATPGSIVRIAAGTYTGLDNRDLDPQGKSITIQGLSAATTIIDCQGSAGSPHRGFSITSGGPALVIEHLTITNGYESRGGAMDIWNASPTVQHCVFSNCSTTGNGGAIALDGVAVAAFDNCAFDQCSAASGGALFAHAVGNPVFTNCSFTGSTSSGSGGAVFCDAFPASFTNCMFTSNTGLGSGGALWIAFGASAYLMDCDLIGNSAHSEGGAILFGSNGATLMMVDCSVNANTVTNSAGSGGGGLHFWGGTTTLTRCLFDGNNSTVAGSGGGIEVGLGGILTMMDCTVSNNSVAQNGGGIFVVAGASVTITDCAITQNTALGERGGGVCALNNATCDIFGSSLVGNSAPGVGGGGIWFEDVSGTIEDCDFLVNTAGHGGGIQMVNATSSLVRCLVKNNSVALDGGGIETAGSSDLTMQNCTVVGNSASGWYGGLRLGGGNATLTGCLVAENTAAGSGSALGLLGMATPVDVVNCTLTSNVGSSGAVRCESSQLNLVNSIVWGNLPGSIDGAGGGTISVSYSDIQGGYPGTGNIATDPLFMNPLAGDYHLGIGSPAIDTGDTLAVPVALVTDLDGNPRIFGPAVDMGADEFAPLFAGTGDDLLMVTTVDGGGAGINLVTAPAGSYFAFSMTSPGTTMVGGLALVIGNYFPSSSPPTPTLGVPGLHIDLATVVVLVDVVAPPPFGLTYLGPDGINWTYLVPPGLGGFTLRLQGVVLSPLAGNGAYAITDGSEVLF